MTTMIDVFYQGEGIRQLEHIEIASDHTFAEVKTLIAGKHGIEATAFFFLEDDDDPVEEVLIVRERVGSAGIKGHLHRCRHIDVTVTYNGQRAEHRFSPGVTVAKVKRWAAEKHFGMSEGEASEHVLQIAGSQARPSPGTHIGALTSCPDCAVRFHLVADQRINGFPGAA